MLTPEQYNQLFTMHGVTMILWYAFPVLTGFSVYLQPLLLGTRDMAFPRLNAFTYWVFLLSGIFLYVSFLLAAAPNAGWFNYTPYAARAFNPGPNIDFYALANILLGISTTLGSINFIVTLLRMRAPGMSINRLPILSWGTLTISFGLIFSMPSVSLAFFFLWMDRQFGTHFCRAPTAASRCSGSICSGCGGIRGSMRSCCRRSAWSRRSCRYCAAVRSSAIPPSRWRRS